MGAKVFVSISKAMADSIYSKITGTRRSDFKTKLGDIDKKLQDTLHSVDTLICFEETSKVSEYVNNYSSVRRKVIIKLQSLDNRTTSQEYKNNIKNEVSTINAGGDCLLTDLEISILGGRSNLLLDSSLISEYSNYLLANFCKDNCISLREYYQFMMQLLCNALGSSVSLMMYYVVASEICEEPLMDSTLQRFSKLFEEIIKTVEAQHPMAFELFDGLFYEKKSYKTQLVHRQSGCSLDGGRFNS